MTNCSEVMTKNPVACAPSDSVQRAATLMKQEDVGPIPVIESGDSNRLLGIVTDRDLTLRVLAEGRDPNNTKVEEVMSQSPATCTPDEDLQKAFDTMAKHQVRRIPVVDAQNQLAGIISQADVATRTGATKECAEVVGKVSQSAAASA